MLLSQIGRCLSVVRPLRPLALSACHCPHRDEHSRTISSKTLAIYKKEIQAVYSLLNRSMITVPRSGFHTSATVNHQPPPFGPPKGSEGKDGDEKKKKDEDEDKTPSLLSRAIVWMITAYMFIVTLSLLFPGNEQQQIMQYVSWNEFLYHMLAKGEVEKVIVRPDMDIVTVVLYEGAIIKGKKIEQRTYHMNVADMHKFEDKLREAEQLLGIKEGVTVVYERGADAAGKILITLIFLGLLLSLLSRSRTMKSPISFDSISQLGRAKFTLVDSLTGAGKGVKFADVAGLKEAKQEIMEFVDYLKRPDFYKNLGAKVPKGALLLGPPGCGKTLLAKAVATEANVPFLSMNGSEFIEMIGGLGAARVRDLFKEAGKRSPCIIYIDEIDAIGKKRSGLGPGGNMGGSTGEGEQTLNQLLVEMDGMASREGVIMLASTNRADVLDKALLRPGRFDRHILIDLPTLQERQEIFERHLKSIVLEHEPSYYSKRLSYLSPGFSGADIANVCNEAALHAARVKNTVVKGDDLEYAIERLVGGTEKKNHAMSQAEKKIVAYHESGHALVGWLLEHTDALLKVTIVPRTSLALGFAQYTPRDQKLYSKEELFDRMCMALGGRAAEAIKFNSITTGAQNDLQKVTNMAYAQVKHYGMSETVGLISFEQEDYTQGRSPYSKTLKSLIDLEARKMVSDAYFRTEKVLKSNMDKLEKLAQNLLEKETLNYDDVVNLIGPPPNMKNLIEPVQFEQTLNQLAKDGETPPKEAREDTNTNKERTQDKED